MKLKDVAVVKVGLKSAHFWLVRRGSVKLVGKPVRVFNPEHIGIEVLRKDILLPDFLYYSLTHIHSTGAWEQYAHGTLSLVNIRTSDVKNIEFSGGEGH